MSALHLQQHRSETCIMAVSLLPVEHLSVTFLLELPFNWQAAIAVLICHTISNATRQNHCYSMSLLALLAWSSAATMFVTHNLILRVECSCWPSFG